MSPHATSDAASFPVSSLMGGRDQDRTGEAASGAASSPPEFISSGLARPITAGARLQSDLLKALRKIGVIA